jgi:hypothetical protein
MTAQSDGKAVFIILRDTSTPRKVAALAGKARAMAYREQAKGVCKGSQEQLASTRRDY